MAEDSSDQPPTEPVVVPPDAAPEAAPAGGSTPAMRTRNAALGTLSTFSRASVITRTLAVMPGIRREPVLEKPITAT